MIIYDALIIGSGAAGYSTADWLFKYNIKNIAVITENINFGTSRNTGSDKQTYYKLSLTSGEDSVYSMAKTLFDGGSADGDICYIEAASSVRSFMRLVEYGVPFPTNEYGVYVGYQTDHDQTARATSVGPLTSKVMTEKLEAKVRDNQTPIIDKMMAVKLLSNENGIYGVICLNLNKKKLETFFAKNIILACGGPAGIYKDSVYPKSQNGATNLALDIGASLSNFSEWQYGLGSVKFRWNLSGSYQQVMPRYISVDKDGNEYEFLNTCNDNEMLENIFLKGYQWPFDCEKINGSSKIDYLVYQEIYEKNNKVYLDFSNNPSGYDFNKLPQFICDYLIKSDAVDDTPIKRLQKLNPKSVELYKTNGIDLEKELLEIGLNAQHNNGGIKIDSNWQTDINGLFAVGEISGAFGIYRPGGSALNDTQVGGLRIAEFLAKNNREITIDKKYAYRQSEELSEFIEECINGKDTLKELDSVKKELSKVAGAIRDGDKIEKLLKELIIKRENFTKFYSISNSSKIGDLFKSYGNLTTSIALLENILQTMNKSGSRVSLYIKNGKIMEEDKNYREYVSVYKNREVRFVKRKPLPDSEEWFEKVWNNFNKGAK